MAKRYTEEEKQKIREFVSDHDQKNNGRGGKAAAAKEFGINTNSIRSWLAASGEKKTTKRRGKAKAAKTLQVAARGAASPVRGATNSKVLEKMLRLQNQIDDLKSEFDKLKSAL